MTAFSSLQDFVDRQPIAAFDHRDDNIPVAQRFSQPKHGGVHRVRIGGTAGQGAEQFAARDDRSRPQRQRKGGDEKSDHEPS